MAELTGGVARTQRVSVDAASLGLLVFLVGAVVADLLHPNRATQIVLIVAPAIAATLFSPRRTFAFTCVAALLFVFAPRALIENGDLHVVRIGAFIGIASLACSAAWWRERLTATVIQLEERRTTEQRQRQEALELNDAVAQRLLAAYLMLIENNGDEEASQLVLDALEATQSMIRDLLHETPTTPGSFVRITGPVTGPSQ